MSYTIKEKFFLAACMVAFFVSCWLGWQVLHRDVPEENWFMDWQIEQPIWIIEGGSLC